jgi:nucleotide-binding universal stress UspA family protein
MIKDVIVNLSIGRERDVAADYAISIGQAFGAHVAAVGFAYEPVLPLSIMTGIPAALIESQRRDNEKAAADTIGRFENAARLQSVSSESRVMRASFADASNLFGQMARRFDLCVVGQAEPDKIAPEEVIIEAALFESGRPVIAIPYIQREPLKLDRIMVCWDGSRSASRAIGDAMPLLRRAKRVDVVVVTNGGIKSDEVPGADIAQHLARHDLNVEVERIGSGAVDVANTLLPYAADLPIDLIVMGAYGHSRLREFVLGGATRGMLSSMTVPVLMSH